MTDAPALRGANGRLRVVGRSGNVHFERLARGLAVELPARVLEVVYRGTALDDRGEPSDGQSIVAIAAWLLSLPAGDVATLSIDPADLGVLGE